MEVLDQEYGACQALKLEVADLKDKNLPLKDQKAPLGNRQKPNPALSLQGIWRRLTCK